MFKTLLPIACLICQLWLMPTAIARANGEWLDQHPLTQWNVPGTALPSTTAVAVNALSNPSCADARIASATSADQVIDSAGWHLAGRPQVESGVEVILAANDFDGMCRPWQFQVFVFVDGVFAGAISPVLMDSRGDGAVGRLTVKVDQVVANFARYADSDPLCCPSRTSLATYRLDRGQGQPALVIESVVTQPTK